MNPEMEQKVEEMVYLELDHWRAAGREIGKSLGALYERKRIAHSLLGRVCTSYQLYAECEHKVCAGFFQLTEELNFGETSLTYFSCKCGNKCSARIVGDTPEKDKSCASCKAKMNVKEIVVD